MNYLKKIYEECPLLEENRNSIILSESLDELKSNEFFIPQYDYLYLLNDLLNTNYFGEYKIMLKETTKSIFNKSKSSSFLRFYFSLQKELEEDEIRFLRELKNKDIKIEDTMDLVGNKFINLNIIRNEFPKEKLKTPENEQIYIHHLLAKNIIEWPVYKQDPIVESNKQTGIKRFSKISLTALGISFLENTLGDN